MEANKTPYPDFDNSGLKYEFVTEMSADIWKISRKSDRMEYLAQNVTFMILRDDKGDRELTDYGHLLAPHGEDLIQQIKVVLNHPNLVNLVDSFAIDFSPAGSRSRKQWFLVWDYCDAGNLGNLFVPPQPRPQDRPSSLTVKEEDGNGDTEMKDMPLSTKAQEEHQMFLPESFCWHVLTSVLRALAWLHDGIRDVVVQDRHWERLGEDIDWSPMLHRNITPQNIFLGHPRRRESYGPVKLGNYGRLFVSGHCQIAGDKHEPTLSKAIGPHPSQDYTPLDELIALDMSLGNVYPYQPDQPYTMISEYRALGEIIQGMMIEPTGGSHIAKIQSKRPRENVANTKYTGRLKNFVVKLMEVDPWSKLFEAEPNPAFVTSDLYREALEGAEWFVTAAGNDGDAYVASRMAEAEDYVENTETRAQQLFGSYLNVQEVLEKFKSEPPSDGGAWHLDSSGLF